MEARVGWTKAATSGWMTPMAAASVAERLERTARMEVVERAEMEPEKEVLEEVGGGAGQE